MSLRQYYQICVDWEDGPTNALFGRVVAGANVLSMSQKDLAQEFEVAESTISRWAKGYARPHSRVQRYVVAKLKKRTLRAMNARERVAA